MSKQLMEVSLGLSLDDAAAIIHGLSIPGSEGGNPDTVGKGSLYFQTASGAVWKKIADGSGVDKWAEIPSLTTPKGLNNFNGLQTIDYFLVDETAMAKWVIEIALSSDLSRRYIAEVTAAHNGTPTADATRVDYNQFGILELGTGIPGLVIQCGLSGVGASQTVNLTIGASSNIDVITRRLSFGDKLGNSTPLDLTTVPHDISSTLLGNPDGDALIMFFTPSRSFSIPANFTNSKAVAVTAGTGSTQFSVYKSSPPYSSDTLVGTITFGANSKTGTFSASSATSLQAGDMLKVVAPTTPDANLSDICITIQANYV